MSVIRHCLFKVSNRVHFSLDNPYTTSYLATDESNSISKECCARFSRDLEVFVRSDCKNYAQCRVGGCRKQYKCVGATNSSMNYHLAREHPNCSESRQKTATKTAQSLTETPASSSSTSAKNRKGAPITDSCKGFISPELRISRMCATEGFTFSVSWKSISFFGIQFKY